MKTLAYKIVSTLIRLFSKKPRIYLPDGFEFESETPQLFVANHERLAGPILMDTYFPVPCRPWIIDKMLEKDAIIEYVAETFFAGRLQLDTRLSRLYASLLAPLIENVMNSTDPIPVYQNQYRIKDTFHLSMQALKNRQNLLIFPEQKGVTAEGFQHIFTLNTGFLYLARQYFRELRESLRIVPVAINPNLPAIAVGTAVQFDPNQPYEQEKKRLVHHIMEQIEMLYDPEANHSNRPPQ